MATAAAAHGSVLAGLQPDELRAALLDLAERRPATRKALLMLLQHRAAVADTDTHAANGHSEGGTAAGEGGEGGEAVEDTALMAMVNGHLFFARVVTATACTHCGEVFASGEVDGGGESCECEACAMAVHRKCIPYTALCLAEKERRRSRRNKSARPGSAGRSATAGGNGGMEGEDTVTTPDGDSHEGALNEEEEEEEEGESDSEDAGFDEVSENSSDGEEDGEANSDDDNDHEADGVAAVSSISVATVGAPIKVALVKTISAVATVDTPTAEDTCVERQPSVRFDRHRKHGRTGAAEDWKKHTMSFRKRLSSSRRLDYVNLARAISNEQHLNHEFDHIPENIARMEVMPRRTDDKNRYFNILPNNHSRVVLPRIDDDETTEYINANFITGYEGKADRYIAAQGPLERTIGDFWRMIWEFEIPVIVMNTNLYENDVCKCERYWPAAVGESFSYAGMTITLVSETPTCAQFTTSKLKISRGETTRQVVHLWWRDWPDKGVPTGVDGLFPFITTARELTDAAEAGPMLVHCSAGVGRTGCFINIDIGMQQWDKEGAVDILASVCRMRRARGLSVQTAVQYRYIHTALHEYMRTTPRSDQPESMQGLDVATIVRQGSSRRSRGSGKRESSSAASVSVSATAAPGTGTAAAAPLTGSGRSGATLDPALRPGSLRGGEGVERLRLPSVAAARAVFEAAASALAKNAEAARPRSTLGSAMQRMSGRRPKSPKKGVTISESASTEVQALRAQWSPKTMRRRSTRHGFRSMKRRSKTAVLEDDITAPGDHEFNTRTYVRDTVCDVCCEALFGLAQQGMRCRRCKANIHHYCLADAPAVCQYRGAMAHDALPQWPPPRRSEVAEEA